MPPTGLEIVNTPESTFSAVSLSSYACLNHQRWDRPDRYYISRVASPSASQLPQLPISVPAHDLERLVLEQVESLLKSPDLDRQLLNSEDRNAHEAASVLRTGERLGEQWKDLKPGEQRQWLVSIIQRIEVGSDSVTLGIRREHFRHSLLTHSQTKRKKRRRPLSARRCCAWAHDSGATTPMRQRDSHYP
jgi:hypothetical protein